MKIDAASMLSAILIGASATLLLDIWSLFLQQAFKVPFPNLCLLGRWLGHMPRGKFMHVSLANATRMRAECAVGWIAHYAIGAVFALAFVALAPAGWLGRPTLFPALLFGLVTVQFPYLVMQPAFGLGVAASKTPKPSAARVKSLVSHGVFGVGLYLSAVAANRLSIIHG
ncbi:MAG: DUF2938 domain-containing protein [Steroidobacteraceae bacterium]